MQARISISKTKTKMLTSHSKGSSPSKTVVIPERSSSFVKQQYFMNKWLIQIMISRWLLLTGCRGSIDFRNSTTVTSIDYYEKPDQNIAEDVKNLRPAKDNIVMTCTCNGFLARWHKAVHIMLLWCNSNLKQSIRKIDSHTLPTSTFRVEKSLELIRFHKYIAGWNKQGTAKCLRFKCNQMKVLTG